MTALHQVEGGHARCAATRVAAARGLRELARGRAVTVLVAMMAMLILGQARSAPVPDPGTAPAVPANAPAADPAAAQARQKQQAQLEAALARSAALVTAGKAGEAVESLRETEQKFPDSARVALDLGAALELAGSYVEARDWVREGLKRDAALNGASEWLHVRILEARIALAKDSAWFARNTVLGLDFGKGDVPVAPEILPIEQGRIKGADQLLQQIDYQLGERTKFVKPPDPVLGDLYASAGDLAIASALSPLDDRKSKLEPERYYERALEFGAPHADLIRKRLSKYRADYAALPPAPKEEVAEYPTVSPRFAPPAQKSYRNWIFAGVGIGAIVLVLGVAAILDRRRRKLAAENPPPPLPDI